MPEQTEAGLRAAVEAFVEPLSGVSLGESGALGGLRLDDGKLSAEITLGFPVKGYEAEFESALGDHLAAQGFSGSLDLALDVSGEGADLQPLLASLGGSISASVRDGRLADRTVNLAGQNIVAWVFTRSADGSAALECLEVRFDFRRGVGTAEQLVFETDKVQAVGGGTLDLRNATMDLMFVPRPRRDALTGEVGGVALSGPLSAPEVKLADGAVAAKVIGDTIGLPLRALGALVGAGGRAAGTRRPCVVAPERNGPEAARPRQQPSESPFLSPQ